MMMPMVVVAVIVIAHHAVMIVLVGVNLLGRIGFGARRAGRPIGRRRAFRRHVLGLLGRLPR